LAVIAAASAALLAACGSSQAAGGNAAATTSAAPDNAPISLTVGYLSGADLSAFIANKLGYFKQENISVKFVQLAAGPQIIAANATGKIDISFGDTFAFASAIANGFTDLRIIHVNANGLYSNLVVSPKSGIRSAADLAGKKIGVSPTPFTRVLIDGFAAKAGVNPSSITYTNVAVGGQVAAIKSGQVDGVWAAVASSGASGLTTAEVEKAGGTAIPLNGVVPTQASPSNYYTTTKFIQAHPGVTQRFVDALRKADAYYNAASTAQKIQLAGTAFGLDYATLSKSYPSLLTDPSWSNPQGGALNVKATQTWINLGVKYGGIAKPVNIAPYVYSTATSAG
jgi:NitT/TauT family transport system substrate-binding protein